MKKITNYKLQITSFLILGGFFVCFSNVKAKSAAASD